MQVFKVVKVRGKRRRSSCIKGKIAVNYIKGVKVTPIKGAPPLMAFKRKSCALLFKNKYRFDIENGSCFEIIKCRAVKSKQTDCKLIQGILSDKPINSIKKLLSLLGGMKIIHSVAKSYPGTVLYSSMVPLE